MLHWNESVVTLRGELCAIVRSLRPNKAFTFKLKMAGVGLDLQISRHEAIKRGKIDGLTHAFHAPCLQRLVIVGGVAIS